MSGGLRTMALVLIAVLAAALVQLRRYRKRQELLQERILTSETFLCVRPLLERCRTLRVERVILRPEGVTVTLYDPPGKMLRCAFDEHGLDHAAPEPLLALAHAATEVLPMLGDNRQYFFKVHKEETGDEAFRWYEYMIQADYKDSVLRQRYDRMES